MRLALRSLARNRWRSVLTAGGVAVAVAFIVWIVHMADAMFDGMIGSITDAELGDVQITSVDWVEERSLYNAITLTELPLDRIRTIPGVVQAAPRVQGFGLIGHEKHSQVARLIGVDAVAEAGVTDTAQKVRSGAWLSAEPKGPPAAREVVLGKTLASTLGVEVGDELVVFLTGADGSLGNDLLKVVGVAHTGNSNIDRLAAWMHLADVQWLTALEGRAHEVAVSIERGADLAVTVPAIRAVVANEKLAVRGWNEIVPEFEAMVDVSASAMWIFYVVIFFIAGLGILNTQRMTALERRREFGVLLAIGTTPWRLARQVLAETAILTFAGGVLGALLGGGLTWYHQLHGFRMQGVGEGDETISYMGVEFDVFYFQLDPQNILTPLIGVTLVGLLCGIWPAISSALLDMPRAISGRT